MTRHRKRAKLYTKLPSDTIRDERLTLRSLGLLAVILNLPDDWIVRADNLAASRIEGRDAVAACLRNLAQCGYYRVERRRMRNGRFQMGTAIAEDSVPEWEAEYTEFDGKPIPLIEQPDGTFKVKRKDGTLTDDGFVGEFHPSRKDFPMPGLLPGQTGHGFSGSGQNDLDPAGFDPTHETDITGRGFSGPDDPASGGTGPFSTTEKYGRDVGPVVVPPGDIGLDLLSEGQLPTVTRGGPAPTAKRKDPLGSEAWRTAGLLPRRYRDGLPRELMFAVVHEIRSALYEGYASAAVLRYAQVCAGHVDYAADKHLPLLRVALGLMRQDVRMGLVCRGCGTEPEDPFGPPCHLCRPAHPEPTAEDAAQFAAARAWLENGHPPDPVDDGHDHYDHDGRRPSPFGPDVPAPQEPPPAGPERPQRGATPPAPPDGPTTPYSGPESDLRGASDARDTRGDGSGHDGGGAAPPG